MGIVKAENSTKMLLHPLRIRSVDRGSTRRSEIKYQIIVGHFEWLPKKLRWPFVVCTQTKAMLGKLNCKHN